MRIDGEHRFEVARETLWQALLDPDVLAATLPGFQRLERVGEHEFAGALALGVGPVQGRFEGRVRLYDLVPPASYSLALEGEGTPGFVRGGGSLHLHEQDGGTRLAYALDVDLGGRIAALGQRLLEMTARTLTRQALNNLERRLREGTAG